MKIEISDKGLTFLAIGAAVGLLFKFGSYVYDKFTTPDIEETRNESTNAIGFEVPVNEEEDNYE